MDLRQLQCFIAVAEELHFGRAAQRLNIAQPPLSRHILNLEAELGAPLFTRTTRNVTLTEEGAAFYNEARPLVSRVQSLPDFFAKFVKGAKGILHIGAVGPALEGPLPCILRKFRRSHPDVIVQIHILGTKNQIEKLGSGQLHIGFVRPFYHDFGALKSVVVSSEQYVLAAPSDHSLARRKRVSIGELDGEDLIFFPRETHPFLYDAILSEIHNAGARVRITQEADSKSMMLAMVASGLGVALVPESSTSAKRPDIAYIKLIRALPSVDIHAVWSEANDSSSLLDFTKELSACGRA